MTVHRGKLELTRVAGAEFAEFVLKAAFGGEQVKPVQAYVFLGADAGGEAVKKEIGSDLDYFSVNIQLGVSQSHRELIA